MLLFHIISARPSKQPRTVRTIPGSRCHKLHVELGSFYCFAITQEQIKFIIIIIIIMVSPC